VSKRRNRVCPVEIAGGLDNKIRRWLQNPEKILGPLVKEGMTVLDVGCGPGFFAIEMAPMVGDSGRVIAADLQDGMLQIVRDKIAGTAIENRISLHKCEERRIGLPEKVDFVLAFYMLHELPDQDAFFIEIGEILTADGQLLLVEPPFHVSKSAFNSSLEKARKVGLKLTGRPKVFFSRTALLTNCRG
jgi:ubiquinone/menaquinone biosynthesis C-methylase UbiE